MRGVIHKSIPGNYFDSYFQSSREALLVISRECTVLNANRSALEMTDYSADEITSIKVDQLFRGEEFSEWLNMVTNPGKEVDGDELSLKESKISICTKHNHEIPGLVNCSAILEESGTVNAIVLAVTDITENLYLEAALFENEEKLRNITRYANDAIIMIDANGKICFWNDSATRIFGYKEEEIYGIDLHSILAPGKYREYFLKGFAEFRNTGEGSVINRTIELSALRNTGEEFPIELSISAYRKKSKWHSIGIVRDISERKNSERKIVESERYHRALIETSPSAIVTTDVEGIITYASEKTFELFNLSKEEEVINSSVFSWIDKEERDESVKTFGDLVKGSEDQGPFRLKLHRSDGTILLADVSAAPIMSAENMIMGLHLNIHDITDREAMIAELKIARDRAEESDRLKSAFIRNISHEIRTPMNSLIGFGELLKEPGISEEERRIFSDNIISGTNQLLYIITVMVDIANIDAGIVKPKMAEISPCVVLEGLMTRNKYKAEQKGLSLRTEINTDCSSLVIVTDETLLTKALQHIIDNAIKYSNKGEITIGLSLEDDLVKVSIKDEGIGIPAIYHKRIFEPFFQVSNGMDRIAEGAGLGLAVAGGFIHLLGGKIELESGLDRGSAFVVSLGRKLSTEEIINNGVGIEMRDCASILVVEDNDSNFDLISNYLGKSCSRIIRAVNGEDAVEKFRKEGGIGLVLMDLHMPVMDGFEATTRIRDLDPDVPIIAQTAYTNEEERSLSSGCNAFISKPFTRNQLLTVIKRVIQ